MSHLIPPEVFDERVKEDGWSDENKQYMLDKLWWMVKAQLKRIQNRRRFGVDYPWVDEQKNNHHILSLAVGPPGYELILTSSWPAFDKLIIESYKLGIVGSWPEAVRLWERTVDFDDLRDRTRDYRDLMIAQLYHCGRTVWYAQDPGTGAACPSCPHQLSCLSITVVKAKRRWDTT